MRAGGRRLRAGSRSRCPRPCRRARRRTRDRAARPRPPGRPGADGSYAGLRGDAVEIGTPAPSAPPHAPPRRGDAPRGQSEQSTIGPSPRIEHPGLRQLDPRRVCFCGAIPVGFSDARRRAPEAPRRHRRAAARTSTSWPRPRCSTAQGQLVPVPAAACPSGDQGPDVRRSDVDPWGRSEHFRELTRRLYDPIYKHWFRVEWEDFDHLPDDRRRAARREPRGRDPARRARDHARHRDGARPPGLRPRREPVPLDARSSARCGRAAAASPRTPTTRTGCCTTKDSSCSCSPRAPRPPASASRERYQLRRFGRGGFVEIAMRAGVPVIPIAVVGAEEAMPIVFKSSRAREAARHPVLPDHREHAA